MKKLTIALALTIAAAIQLMAQDPTAVPSPTAPKFAQVVTPEELALNSRIMELAKSYLGTENASGDNVDPDRNVPNPKIQELAHYVFHGDVPSEEFFGGWCDWFVTAIAVKAGVKDITESMFGVLLLNHGHFVTSPIPGDVVLMEGHIAFYAAEDTATDYIWVLGGNQEYSNVSGGASGASGSGSGSYYSTYTSTPKKKTPLLVHGLELSRGTTVVGDQDVTVHIPAPKVEHRGFGVNYAKIPRSDIQEIFRFNP